MQTIPNLDQLRRYKTTSDNGVEGLGASLYDFQTYAATGQTQLKFFQVPNGQSSKTLQDTNMESAGQLPGGKAFLVESIEVYFFPGGVLERFAVAAAAVAAASDDTYAIFKSGWLDFFVGSKSQLIDAPIGKFPPRTGISTQSALSSNSATVGLNSFDYATMAGQIYTLRTPVLLEANVNFSVSLNWPAVLATPSTVAGRIGISLGGVLYRNA